MQNWNIISLEYAQFLLCVFWKCVGSVTDIDESNDDAKFS